MKAREVMVAWTPGNADHVRVGPWPDKARWSDAYLFTDGACYLHWRECGEEELRTRLFCLFTIMVTRDHMAPAAVHNALLSIDEYRDALPEDSRGRL